MSNTDSWDIELKPQTYSELTEKYGQGLGLMDFMNLSSNRSLMAQNRVKYILGSTPAFVTVTDLDICQFFVSGNMVRAIFRQDVPLNSSVLFSYIDKDQWHVPGENLIEKFTEYTVGEKHGDIYILKAYYENHDFEKYPAKIGKRLRVYYGKLPDEASDTRQVKDADTGKNITFFAGEDLHKEINKAANEYFEKQMGFVSVNKENDASSIGKLGVIKNMAHEFAKKHKLIK